MNRRSGFTLIEVLIVVVIMAVLAATVIPQFSNSAKDAKEGALKFNIHTLRSQIELYKTHHLGAYPTDETTITNQLTKYTDVNGGVSPVATSTHVYGPYLQQQLPVNPFSGSSAVIAASASGAISATAGTGGGYQYRKATGEIFIDHTDYANNPAY